MAHDNHESKDEGDTAGAPSDGRQQARGASSVDRIGITTSSYGRRFQSLSSNNHPVRAMPEPMSRTSLRASRQSTVHRFHPLFATDICGSTCDDSNNDKPCCTLTTCYCGSGCVDVMTNNDNCGGCGTVCQSPQHCTQGSCCGALTSCPPGLCVDTTSDSSNCGGCGMQCDAGDDCCSSTCTDITSDAVHCGNCFHACGPSEDCCSSSCVDTFTDGNNCGECGNICASGSQCCQGACIDVSSDTSNCGACDRSCVGDEICQNGACTCPSGQSLCDGFCRTFSSDAFHCGSCSNMCSGEEICSGGSCQCPSPQLTCGGQCIDAESDETNCGSCSNVCTGGRFCWNGGCICPYGESFCNGQCEDSFMNVHNCGGCGIACGAGEECVLMTCVPICSGANTQCGSKCVNTQTDPNNCGFCNTICGSGVCANGACQCAAGLTGCLANSFVTVAYGGSTVCADLQSDAAHCGVCNKHCQQGATCSDGECVCAASLTQCGNQCVDTSTNLLNCGACGSVCSGHCVGGSCQCNPPLAPCSQYGYGPVVCTSLVSDAQNCGGCGQACHSGGNCVRGTCIYSAFVPTLTCSNGQTSCLSGCATLLVDPDYCGSCTNACSQGFKCCSGTCTDIFHSSSDCGSCGHACASGTVCAQGVCVSSCQQMGLTACPSYNGGSVCVDVSSSVWCGGCGAANICAPQVVGGVATCVGGECIRGCGAGLTPCGISQCALTSSDPLNCGACGTVCSASTTCISGQCVASSSCTYPLQLCGNSCVDLTSDTRNCATCGSSCVSLLNKANLIDAICASGSCVGVCAVGTYWRVDLQRCVVDSTFTPCTPNPCSHGGVCHVYPIDPGYVCACPAKSPGGPTCDGCPSGVNQILCSGQGACDHGVCACGLPWTGALCDQSRTCLAGSLFEVAFPLSTVHPLNITRLIYQTLIAYPMFTGMLSSDVAQVGPTRQLGVSYITFTFELSANAAVSAQRVAALQSFLQGQVTTYNFHDSSNILLQWNATAFRSGCQQMAQAGALSSTQTASGQDSSSKSTPSIIIIVVPIAAVCLLIGCVIFAVCRCRKSKQASASHASNPTAASPASSSASVPQMMPPAYQIPYPGAQSTAPNSIELSHIQLQSQPYMQQTMGQQQQQQQQPQYPAQYPAQYPMPMSPSFSAPPSQQQQPPVLIHPYPVAVPAGNTATSTPTFCSQCGHIVANPSTDRFCPTCGQPRM